MNKKKDKQVNAPLPVLMPGLIKETTGFISSCWVFMS
jgi:hypothetical protein